MPASRGAAAADEGGDDATEAALGRGPAGERPMRAVPSNIDRQGGAAADTGTGAEPAPMMAHTDKDRAGAVRQISAPSGAGAGDHGRDGSGAAGSGPVGRPADRMPESGGADEPQNLDPHTLGELSDKLFERGRRAR